jgi:hypothetical protein
MARVLRGDGLHCLLAPPVVIVTITKMMITSGGANKQGPPCSVGFSDDWICFVDVLQESARHRGLLQQPR